MDGSAAASIALIGTGLVMLIGSVVLAAICRHGGYRWCRRLETDRSAVVLILGSLLASVLLTSAGIVLATW